MIEVEKAINLVQSSQIKLEIIELDLMDALGCCLAENISSPIDMPPFSQSAMDGYAICGEGNKFDLVGEVKAGDVRALNLEQGKATRIFTGAMIPIGTTAIAKQEIVERIGDIIHLQEEVNIGTSIRQQGEEVKSGECVLQSGTEINPAAIGLLSGLGIARVKVYRRPNIQLIVTGDELTKLGDRLVPGKIYESNSYTLRAALREAGFHCSVSYVKDNYQDTKSLIEKAIQTNDLVIMTGGISVGDYDFVGRALDEIGVNQVFYKVKQKPGKPLYYGELNNVKIFALPGNPAAALTCIHIYVKLAIKLMMGNANPMLQKRSVTMAHSYAKKGDRAQFLKAQIKDNKVTVHSGQSSAMLSSFVDANCLLYINNNTKEVSTGDTVEAYVLP